MKASVIIPTYNKLGRLKLVIESLKYQSEAKENFEVIIVDDGSSDGTREYLNNLKLPFNWHSIYQENSGRASARNRGVSDAENDLIIFLDDDLVLDHDFIHKHIKAHLEGNKIVHGKIMNLPFTKFFKDPVEGTFMDGLNIKESTCKVMKLNCIDLEMLKPELFDEKIKKKSRITALESLIKILLKDYPGMADWISCVGGNLSIPKKIFQEVNGFDEKFGLKWGCEDIELGYRLMENKYKFYYSDEAVNYHVAHYRKNFEQEHETNLKYFYQKYKDENIILFHDFISDKITKEEFVKKIHHS